MKPNNLFHGFSRKCNIPRRQKAIQAILSLFWLKPKDERPEWLVNEVNSLLD